MASKQMKLWKTYLHRLSREALKLQHANMLTTDLWMFKKYNEIKLVGTSSLVICLYTKSGKSKSLHDDRANRVHWGVTVNVCIKCGANPSDCWHSERKLSSCARWKIIVFVRELILSDWWRCFLSFMLSFLNYHNCDAQWTQFAITRNSL